MLKKKRMRREWYFANYFQTAKFHSTCNYLILVISNLLIKILIKLKISYQCMI